MNHSIILYGTKKCFEWCKDQHFINQNNLVIEAMVMPALALLSLMIANIIYAFSDKIIEKSDLTEDNLLKMYHLCNDFAKYLLIGFFIWWVWFK